jgi:hypothetical protein
MKSIKLSNFQCGQELILCVLNKGVIANSSIEEGKASPLTALPYPSSQLVGFATSRALLLFYTLISHYLHQAYMPNFRISDYTSPLDFTPGNKYTRRKTRKG